MTHPLPPEEPPVEHVANAVAILQLCRTDHVGGRTSFTTEEVDAVLGRLHRALEQLREQPLHGDLPPGAGAWLLGLDLGAEPDRTYPGSQADDGPGPVQPPGVWQDPTAWAGDEEPPSADGPPYTDAVDDQDGASEIQRQVFEQDWDEER